MSQKKYYPFKVRVENSGDNFYLIEEDPTKKEGELSDEYNNDYLGTIFLDILTLEGAVANIIGAVANKISGLRKYINTF
jgi:hypothetical protein